MIIEMEHAQGGVAEARGEQNHERTWWSTVFPWRWWWNTTIVLILIMSVSQYWTERNWEMLRGRMNVVVGSIMVALWLGISIPLTFIGSYFGFKKHPVQHLV